MRRPDATRSRAKRRLAPPPVLLRREPAQRFLSAVADKFSPASHGVTSAWPSRRRRLRAAISAPYYSNRDQGFP